MSDNVDDCNETEVVSRRDKKRRSSFFIRHETDDEDDTLVEEVPPELEQQLVQKIEKFKTEKEEWSKLYRSLKQKYKQLKIKQDNEGKTVQQEKSIKMYLTKNDEEYLAKFQNTKKEYTQMMLKLKETLDCVHLIIEDCKNNYNHTQLLIDNYNSTYKKLEEVICKESEKLLPTTQIQLNRNCTFDKTFLCCDEDSD